MRLACTIVACLALCAPAPQNQPADARRLLAAISNGTLAWQLSEVEEVRAALGGPRAEETRRDGGLELRIWTYGDTFSVIFARDAGSDRPFVLFGARDGERRLAMSAADRLVLRTPADLAKLRPFTGLQGVDASRLDLRAHEAAIRRFAFDTRTLWPAADRLPAGFDPARILEDGKNPGLGVRALHRDGIDGRGVTLGIIDQPLLPNHREVAGRLEVVAELDVKGVPPQMHGPAVSSLAAGRTCGVAPGARAAYVSMAMWKSQAGNQIYIDALERLLERREAANLRVVSISSGVFAGAPQAEEWKAALGKAEAQGVLVITCDLKATGFDYGLLRPVPGADRDTPEGYTKGSYGRGLLVPGDGRTYAHTAGEADYVYHPDGGMSWAAPYLAGLAALGFQVNPGLTPARVRGYLLKSATQMPYGDVVNPAAFIRLCREDPDGRR